MNTTPSTSRMTVKNGAGTGEPPIDDGSWVGKTWAIRYSDPAIEFLLPQGCRFRLAAVDDGSQRGFYRLEFDGDNMTPHWQGLTLIENTGIEPRMEKLTPWADNDQVKGEYVEYLRQFRERYLWSAEVKRLEGVIRVNDEPEIVRFYRSPGAICNNNDWIVVNVLVPTRQNGTAHGDPWVPREP